LETFAAAREFVNHARYSQDRRETLAALDLGSIDKPIVDIIAGFAALPHCFTLQCCYGHFVCTAGQDPQNFDPIPLGHTGLVRYRIAYLGICLENSRRGRVLQQSLARVPALDPGYIQFGSADWFREHWVNSYALQVEPVEYQLKDEAMLEPTVALHTQGVRDLFFRHLREILAAELSRQAAG
jgi:hypothetical protein